MLIGLVGFQFAFWIDALTYLCSGLILLRLPRVQLAPVSQSSYWTQTRAGVAYIFSDPVLRHLISAHAVSAICIAAQMVVGVVLAVSVLEVGSAGFGAMEATMALGAVMGTLLVPMATARLSRERLFMIGLAGCGIMIALVGAKPVFGWVLFFHFLAGIFNMVFFIPMRSLLQLRTPPELRGRTFTAFQAVVGGAALLGQGLAGIAANWFGPAAVFMIAGIGMMLVAGGVFLQGGFLRNDAPFNPEVLPR